MFANNGAGRVTPRHLTRGDLATILRKTSETSDNPRRLLLTFLAHGGGTKGRVEFGYPVSVPGL